MKPLLWVGIVLVALGIGSLFIAIPNTEKKGVKVGGVSLGVETHNDEKISPWISGVMILAGAGLVVMGRKS